MNGYTVLVGQEGIQLIPYCSHFTLIWWWQHTIHKHISLGPPIYIDRPIWSNSLICMAFFFFGKNLHGLDSTVMTIKIKLKFGPYRNYEMPFLSNHQSYMDVCGWSESQNMGCWTWKFLFIYDWFIHKKRRNMKDGFQCEPRKGNLPFSLSQSFVFQLQRHPFDWSCLFIYFEIELKT